MRKSSKAKTQVMASSTIGETSSKISRQFDFILATEVLCYKITILYFMEMNHKTHRLAIEHSLRSKA